MKILDIHKRLWRFTFHFNLVDFYQKTRLGKKIIPIFDVSIYRPDEGIGISVSIVSIMFGVGFFYGGGESEI